MAFYSKCVNDVGVEIDGPGLYKEYPNAVSDRESSVSRQAFSLDGIYSRCTNSATCISKADTSMESLSDVFPPIVPPLDLNSSGESMPSTDSAPGMNFTTIHKTCEANMISRSEAFYNWLSAKKKLKSYEKIKEKEHQNELQRQLKERKQLAEKKYQDWLVEKTKPKETPQLRTEMQRYQRVYESPGDSEKIRKAWEKKKMNEQRRKREQILEVREQQKMLEEKRKEQANRAWQSWLAEAPFKPKPVPLNKGFLSLKGTISDIYINPNPWREPFEPQDEVKCDKNWDLKY